MPVLYRAFAVRREDREAGLRLLRQHLHGQGSRDAERRKGSGSRQGGKAGHSGGFADGGSQSARLSLPQLRRGADLRDNHRRHLLPLLRQREHCPRTAVRGTEARLCDSLPGGAQVGGGGAAQALRKAQLLPAQALPDGKPHSEGSGRLRSLLALRRPAFRRGPLRGHGQRHPSGRGL